MGLTAYCIVLDGHPYSENVGERCIRTAAEIGGLNVERFRAVTAGEADEVMREHSLRWTWGEGRCRVTGLNMHRYGGGKARVGCAMSHYLLWLRCMDLGEPVLILEHDAVFLRTWPKFQWSGICMVNDPAGATRRGAWWSAQMKRRGPGVWPKTWVTDPADKIPDGLAGNSAYVIHPHAARELVALYRAVGVWPNDATMCEQLVPGLQELYPWVTRVEQLQSTTSA